MKPGAKRITRNLSLAAAVVLLAAAVFVFVTAQHIASPLRRKLQDYHQSWLDQPELHGVHISRDLYLDGDAPCLLVIPRGAVSKRGEVVRRQLREMGHDLGEFGVIRGTLVLLHGRNGRKEDLLPVAERFCAAGFRCLLPDLPSHGESPIEKVYFATTSGEADFVNRLLIEVSEQSDSERTFTGIWGMSMGGAFAVRNVNRNPELWDSMVVVSSFDSLSGVIHEQSQKRAWLLGPAFARGVESLLRRQHGLDPAKSTPAEWIQEIDIPLLIAHGTDDSLISIRRGRHLYDAAMAHPKAWVEVEGGDHDNVLITDMPLYAIMVAWYLEQLTE